MKNQIRIGDEYILPDGFLAIVNGNVQASYKGDKPIIIKVKNGGALLEFIHKLQIYNIPMDEYSTLHEYCDPNTLLWLSWMDAYDEEPTISELNESILGYNNIIASLA